jgi:hypothetical protein
MLQRKKKGQVDALGSGRNLPTVRGLSEIIFLTMDHGLSNNKGNQNPMLYNIFAKNILHKFVKHTLIYMSEDAHHFCYNTKLGGKKTLGQEQMQIRKCTAITFPEMSSLPSHLLIGLE